MLGALWQVATSFQVRLVVVGRQDLGVTNLSVVRDEGEHPVGHGVVAGGFGFGFPADVVPGAGRLGSGSGHRVGRGVLGESPLRGFR